MKNIDSKSFKNIPNSIAVLLIIIIGFLVYGNSLSGRFIWDDYYLIRDNTYIKDLSNISNIFGGDIVAWTGIESNSYRPLQIFTYAIDYYLWELNARWYHLTNILLHILVALCVYRFCKAIFNKDVLLSLLTSLFFVVHPIHTEAVSYISGRADLLVTLFLLICFIFYIKSIPKSRPINFCMVLVSYILALLSRENSLIFPFLLLLYHFTFKKKLRPKEFFVIASSFFVYIVLRLSVLGPSFDGPLSQSTALQRVPGFFVAIATYTRLLFLPFNLHMEYGNKLFSIAHPKAIMGVVITFLLLTYAFLERKRNKLVFFSICWFFVVLISVSNIYPVGAYMAEHWLYLPSIGFFLILAGSLRYVYRLKYSKIFIIGLLFFYSWLTVKQNHYWNEPMAFYKRTIKYSPDSFKAHNNLGLHFLEEGNFRDAISYFNKAIEINQNYFHAYNNLGNAYDAMGRRQEAIGSYKKAIEINPKYTKAYINLGVVYESEGGYKEALSLYKEAIAINPKNATAYYNLGNVYYALGRFKEAIGSYKKAIEINPKYTKAYNNIAILYFNNKQHELSVEYYKKAEEFGFINPFLSEASKL